MRAIDLAQQVPGSRQRGDRWDGFCPAHDDRQNRSLSFRDGDRGILINCFAGCSTDAICQALGLHLRDLFFDATPSNGQPTRQIAQIYDYRDATGALLFQVVRFTPKEFRQRRPDGNGGWVWNLNGVARVLYCLPEILADATQPIVFHEGEKACEAAITAGLSGCHTTTSGGASNGHLTDLSPCANHDVTICPDHDAPGQRYADTLAARLHDVGARSVRIVHWPNVPEHGDVVEWLQHGGTPEDFAALCEAAEPVHSVPAPSLPQESPAPAVPTPCTDAGNAVRFATHHQDVVRWCQAWRSWLVYDGTRWVRDTRLYVMRSAKQTARSILDEARQTDDDERRRKLAAWAVTSESEKHLKAMVELAKSEAGISIDPSEFDRDPWLLNLKNGTLDLRSGLLSPHDRAQALTKLVEIEYDLAARCPTWLAFLSRIMNGDTELIDFLQVAFGYSLTGSVREQVLFLAHGSGANGKSTLVRILLKLLGSYAIQTPSETLLLSRQDGGARNDLARFAGARVVAALESDGGRKLAPALLKQLTGNDVLTARFLFCELFEMDPTWKIWFSTNHRPIVNDDGDAIWRRLRLIPFTVRIPDVEQDKELIVRLTEELPGILAWAVQGCLRWQRDGLECPSAVRAATESYREAESTFAFFLAERCVREMDVVETFAALRTEYATWAEESADKPISSKAFAAALAEHGFTPVRMRNARAYRGLRLRTVSDDLADAQALREQESPAQAEEEIFHVD